MRISSISDYREAARRKLPPFLFHYIDGGAYAEYTLGRNVSDLSEIALRQRILRNVAELSLETQVLGQTFAMPAAPPPPRACPLPCPPSRSVPSRRCRPRPPCPSGSSFTS